MGFICLSKEKNRAPGDFVWVTGGNSLRSSDAPRQVSAPGGPPEKPPGKALYGASPADHPGLGLETC